MLITKREKSANNLGRSLPILRLDAEAIAYARKLFDDYRERGIVIGSNFEDPKWKLSNEMLCTTLVLLPFDAEESTGGTGDWLGLNKMEYMKCVKAYMALKVGSLILRTLCALAKELSDLPRKSAKEAVAISHSAFYVTEFLSLLPGESAERDWVVETLDERIQAYRKSSDADCRRVLAAFNSYLRFGEALSEFWQTSSADIKLFYFPVYFWWNLTAILPLRPTEFLLTPRDCLDGNMLTIRRTKLKGTGGFVGHRIAQDYELCRYEITSTLAAEISMYLDLTEHMPESGVDSIFRLEPHYYRLPRVSGNYARYYSYNHLRACLDLFVFNEQEKGLQNIGRINFGDTRHLAMINLIISGGSPSICKELAGHADIGMASHYYSNISTIEESVALARFRKSKAKSAEIAGEPVYPLTRPDNMSRMTGGWCDSDSLKSGEVGDCMKVVDERGRIGECSDCPHFWSDTPGMRLRFFDVDAGKQRVDLDGAFLMRMIALVRRGLGYEEDVTAALLRLQQSCNHLGDCLTMKYLNTEVD
jgi:hypothetical protein